MWVWNFSPSGIDQRPVVGPEIRGTGVPLGMVRVTVTSVGTWGSTALR